jgi:hypothetical protein
MPEQTAPEFERKKWLAEHELRKADHGASKMKKFIMAAALIAAPASVVNARDNEPSREAVEEFAHQLAQDFKKQGMSLAATPPTPKGVGAVHRAVRGRVDLGRRFRRLCEPFSALLCEPSVVFRAVFVCHTHLCCNRPPSAGPRQRPRLFNLAIFLHFCGLRLDESSLASGP